MEQQLHELNQGSSALVTNFDEALDIINHLGQLYAKLDDKSKRRLLKLVLSKIITDQKGHIMRVELLPPFELINDFCGQLKKSLINPVHLGAAISNGGVLQGWHLQCSHCQHNKLNASWAF